jgi:hypothetical protein
MDRAQRVTKPMGLVARPWKLLKEERLRIQQSGNVLRTRMMFQKGINNTSSICLLLMFILFNQDFPLRH